MSKLPLDNILVLDLSTGPAGGLSTMILADFGARVLRPDRPETAPAARSWLRGKRTVDDDQEIDDYTWHADVMLVTSPPEKYRARAMQERNPRLVYCEITAMGQNHPMPLHEPLVAAKAGRMKSLEGIHPQPGPVYAAVQVATHACAQNAVSGILAALLERDRSGKGQQVHTSLLQGLMTYDTGLSLGLQIREKRGWPPFEMDPFTMMPSLNYHPVVCKDGRWLQLGNLLPHLFQRFMQVIGLGDELAKDAYKGPALQWAAADREALRDRILQTMQTKTAAEWMDLFVADGGVACHPWQSGEECLDDPDMVANGHVVEIDGVRQPGPVQLDALPQLGRRLSGEGDRGQLIGRDGVTVLLGDRLVTRQRGRGARRGIGKKRYVDAPVKHLLRRFVIAVRMWRRGGAGHQAVHGGGRRPGAEPRGRAAPGLRGGGGRRGARDPARRRR